MTTYTLSAYTIVSPEIGATPETTGYADFEFFMEDGAPFFSIGLYDFVAPNSMVFGPTIEFSTSTNAHFVNGLNSYAFGTYDVNVFANPNEDGTQSIYVYFQHIDYHTNQYSFYLIHAGGPAQPEFQNFEEFSDFAADPENDFFLTTAGEFITFDLRDIDGVKITQNDVIQGNSYNDTLSLGIGADTFFGNNGNDTVKGGTGADELYGQIGADKLLGQRGADLLKGGRGNDVLMGGKGHDILQGGKGQDLLEGGRGEDLFVFNKKDGIGTITDFEDNIDTLHLSSALWGGIGLSAQEVLDQFAQGFDDGTSSAVVLDFGDTIISLTGLSDVSILANDISIF